MLTHYNILKCLSLIKSLVLILLDCHRLICLDHNREVIHIDHDRNNYKLVRICSNHKRYILYMILVNLLIKVDNCQIRVFILIIKRGHCLVVVMVVVGRISIILIIVILTTTI